MKYIMYIILIIFALIILISLGWRLASYRIEIPCPSWLAWMVEMDNPLSKINRSAQIINHADIQAGMTVIDIGCGPGRVTIPLAHKVGQNGHVVALDVQQEMLNKVAQKAQAENLANIEYVQANLGENKLHPNTFDRALLVTVIGEIPHQKAALQEIFNILKPGGTLSVTEIIFDPHYQRLKSIQNLAKEIGFDEKNLFSDLFAYHLVLEKPIIK